MAKEQKRKNRDAYELAKRRLLLQHRREPDALEGFERGLPKLHDISGPPLDPIGGSDPYEEATADEAVDLGF